MSTLLDSINRLLDVLIDIIGHDNNPKLCNNISSDSDFRSRINHILTAADFVVSEDKVRTINTAIDLVLDSLIYLNVDMICSKLKTTNIDSKQFIMKKIIGSRSIGTVDLDNFNPIFDAIDFIAANPSETIGEYLKRATKQDDGIDL